MDKESIDMMLSKYDTPDKKSTEKSKSVQLTPEDKSDFCKTLNSDAKYVSALRKLEMDMKKLEQTSGSSDAVGRFRLNGNATTESKKSSAPVKSNKFQFVSSTKSVDPKTVASTNSNVSSDEDDYFTSLKKPADISIEFDFSPEKRLNSPINGQEKSSSAAVTSNGPKATTEVCTPPSRKDECCLNTSLVNDSIVDICDSGTDTPEYATENDGAQSGRKFIFRKPAIGKSLESEQTPTSTKTATTRSIKEPVKEPVSNVETPTVTASRPAEKASKLISTLMDDIVEKKTAAAKQKLDSAMRKSSTEKPTSTTEISERLPPIGEDVGKTIESRHDTIDSPPTGLQRTTKFSFRSASKLQSKSSRSSATVLKSDAAPPSHTVTSEHHVSKDDVVKRLPVERLPVEQLPIERLPVERIPVERKPVERERQHIPKKRKSISSLDDMPADLPVKNVEKIDLTDSLVVEPKSSRSTKCKINTDVFNNVDQFMDDLSSDGSMLQQTNVSATNLANYLFIFTGSNVSLYPTCTRSQ